MDCENCKRQSDGIYAVVASLVNRNPKMALLLAMTVMKGGSVLSPSDLKATADYIELFGLGK